MFDYDVYLRMFKDVRMLGEGGYGQVFLGRHMITSEEYAIKFIQPSI
jgi:serine/threonine protein kinase